MPAQENPMPPKSTFRQDVADAICADIESGMSLRKACAQEGRPSPQTVLRWTNENSAFAEQYTRARARLYDVWADQIVDIPDAMESPEEVHKARLQVDSRKWLLSKLLPKQYGDKVDVTSGGETLVRSIDLNVIHPKRADG
jgi:hypothetical protein